MTPRALSLVLFLALEGFACVSARAQSNDSFVNRLPLTGPAPTAISNNLAATRESGEPNHAGASAGRSLWYTWTAPATGTVNFGTYYTGSGAPVMRALAVYTGNSLAALTEIASSNNQTQSYYTYGYYTTPQLAAGTLLNVPVTAGTPYQIALDALTAPTLVDDDGTTVLAINAVPTVVSAASAAATAGVAFSYSVAATGGATAFNATGLPAGLVLNPSTGQIAGTPAAAGTSTVVLSATGPGGTGTATLTLTVSDPAASSPMDPPVITSAASVRTLPGVAFSYRIAATNSPTSFTATGLPDGLTLDTSGLITGTPTGSSQSIAVPITATGSTGTGTAVLTIAINNAPPLPVITSPLSAVGVAGVVFSYTITTNVDGFTGVGPSIWSATSLPPGLTQSNNTFRGTPTQPGTYNVPVTATNAAGTRAASVAITILPAGSTVNSAAPVLGSAGYAGGIVGTAFSYALTASNSPTAFTADSLPAGLSLNAATGVLSGTPTAAGTFAVPVTARNASGTSTGTLTLAIYASSAAQTAANSVALPVITSPAAATGYVGTALACSFAATYQDSGTVTGIGTWTFTATGLPPGLKLYAASSSSSSMTISGTPTTAGTYAAVLTATSPAVTSGLSPRPAATATATVTFVILPAAAATPPLITSVSAMTGSMAYSATYNIAATGKPTSYAASGLPPGMSLDASTGVISGLATVSGTYPVAISATNAAGTGSAVLTVRIVPRPPVFTSATTNWTTVGTTRAHKISVDTPPATYAVDTASLPPGMVFDGTDTIYGKPTTPGIYGIPITATNVSGTTRMILTYTVWPSVVPPIITAAARMTGGVGATFYNGLTSNNQGETYTATNLPPGVTLDPNGQLGGMPTVAGTYRTPVTATNAAGTATGTITFVIAPGAPPWFQGPAAVGGTRNQYFGFDVGLVSGGTPTLTFQNLPPGLYGSMSGNLMGNVSGAPTVAGVYPVKVTATNETGSTTVTITVTITDGTASGAPVISNALGVEPSAKVGSSTSLTLSSSPAATSYTATGLPPGLTLNGATGVISGTPTSAGTYAVPITATNAAGSASAVLTYLILPPTAASPPALPIRASVLAYAGVSHRNSNLDRGVSGVTFAANGLPPGLTLDPATGEITGTPTAAGTYSVDVSAINANGSTGAVWTYIVKDTSALVPEFSGTAAEKSLAYGTALSYTSTVSSTDHGLDKSYSDNTLNGTPPFTFSVDGLPPGASYAYADNQLTISGGVLPIGSYPMTVTATNAGVSATENLLFVVQEKYPPAMDGTAAAAGPAYQPFTYQIRHGTYPDTVTSYSAGPLPPGLSLDATIGTISGTPTVPGTYTVPVTANAPYSSGIATVTFRIDPPLYGGLPILTSAASVGSQDFPPDGSAFSNFLSPVVTYTLTAMNRPTSFAVGNVPPGMVFEPSTGVLSGAPLAVGTYQVPISATNAAGTVNATLTVVARSPRAALSPPLAIGGSVGGVITTRASPYFPSFPTSSIYAAGFGYSAALDPITYRATGLPPGLSLNSQNGQITGTATQAGVYPTAFTVTNRGGTGSAVLTFAIASAGPGGAGAPVWTSAATAVGARGVPMTYTLTAAGATGYAATGLPPGLSFNATTGTISGTPTAAGSWQANVSASNALGTAVALLTLTVDDAPFAPTVTNPAAAIAIIGLPFSYIPTLSNYSLLPATATGYALGAAALPAGLRLNARTGVITGTPTGPAGVYPVPVTTLVGPVTRTDWTLTLTVQSAPTPLTMTSAAGAVAYLGNPFSYAVRHVAFVPDAGSLPAGLAYDAVSGTISGYPQAAGSYSVPLHIPGSGARPALARVSTTAGYHRRDPVAADAGVAAGAVLTLDVRAPGVSLPRLTLQPIGGTVAQGSGFTFAAAAVGAPSPAYQWWRNGSPVPGATGAALVLNPAMADDTGDYVVTASNAAGSVVSGVASLLVRTSYGQWQTDHFTAQEIAAGLADDNASFSGDGVSNLLKYALGLDPREALATALPVTVSRPAADGLLRLEFARDARRSDIGYLVEASPDLQTWRTIAQSSGGAALVNFGAASVVETAVPGTGRSQVTVRAAPTSDPTQFLRLRVVRP